jgi:hypothetical protein
VFGSVDAYLVKASLFRLSRSWPVWAPLSLLFIRLSDWRVAKTASRAWWCQYGPIQVLPHVLAGELAKHTPLPDMSATRAAWWRDVGQIECE